MEIEKTDPIGRDRSEDDPNFDEPMHGFFKSAISLHTNNAAFKTPDFAVLVADDDKNVFVYSRGAGDNRRIVALNRSTAEQTVSLEIPAGEVIFVTQGDPSSILVTGGEGARLLTLPPLTGVVLE